MGRRGPVPNRTDNLSRDRDADRPNRAPLSKGTMRKVTVPKPDVTWHPIARLLWNSAGRSGMVDFFQDSDWAYLFSLCDDLSSLKKARDDGGRVNGQILATIYSAFSSLGFTEGDRRRMRIELENPHVEEVDEAAAAIAEYENVLSIAR